MPFASAILYADNLPVEREHVVTRGDDSPLYFQLEDDAGATVSLTNVTGRMMVRTTPDTTDPPMWDSGALTPDGSHGVLFSIPRATTAGWNGTSDDQPDFAVYDIELQETDGSTRKRTVQRGKIRLIKDVTR